MEKKDIIYISIIIVLLISIFIVGKSNKQAESQESGLGTQTQLNGENPELSRYQQVESKYMEAMDRVTDYVQNLLDARLTEAEKQAQKDLAKKGEKEERRKLAQEYRKKYITSSEQKKIDEYQKKLDKITEKYDEYTNLMMGDMDEGTGEIIPKQISGEDEKKAEQLANEILNEVDKLGTIE